LPGATSDQVGQFKERESLSIAQPTLGQSA
jgi:hypothetical protein